VKKYWYALGTSFLMEACGADKVNDAESYQAELDEFKKWRTPSDHRK